jgi:hypothetical protein
MRQTVFIAKLLGILAFTIVSDQAKLWAAEAKQQCPAPALRSTQSADVPLPALHVAVFERKFGTSARLLREGTAVDQRDVYQSTALARLLRVGIAEPSPQARAAAQRQALRDVTDIPKFMDLLLAAHADPNAADVDGLTPLFVGINHHGGRPVGLVIVRKLLAAGAKPDQADHFGMTPLMMAASRRDTVIVGLLLAKGADKRLRNCDGRTAADFAAASGDRKLAHQLLTKSK